MSVLAIEEWAAFYKLEPFGPMIDNLNFGRLLTFLMNLTRKKGDQAHKVLDVAFGDFEDMKKGAYSTQPMGIQIQKIKAIAEAFGGSVTTKADRDRERAKKRQKARRARRRV